MLKYILRRLVTIIIVIFIVSSITFFLAHAIPGGPFKREKKVPEAVLKNIEKRYKLDQPLWKQYIDFIKNVARLDFGPSFRYESQSVNDIIKQSFPISALLGFLSLLLALFIGIPAGVISSLKQNMWQDNFVMVFSLIGISIPSFILATFLMYSVGLKFRLLPVAGWGSISNLILPCITLSAYPMAFIARIMRSSMLEVLRQDYIRVAYAKGLSRSAVIIKHAIKNSILPVVTYMGPLIASIFTGSFIVEQIFAIPGLGKYFVTSIYDRDYTTILGVTIFYCTILVFLNFIIDIVYSYIDPRIRVYKG